MRVAFIVILLFFNLSLFSQQTGTFQKLDLGINGLSMSLEIPLADKITVEPAIGLGPSYDLHNSGESGLTDKMDWHWTLLEPSFHASVYGKFFYNRNARIAKKKSLRFNSGNYIGLKVKYVSKELSSDYHLYSNTLLLNLHWGGQYNIGKHWFYSYALGIGYGNNLDRSYGLLYPAFDVKIGYVLPFFSKTPKKR